MLTASFIRSTALLMGLVLAVIANTATAATFTVNSTADAVDASPGNGVCATASGACTLRAAIMEANALAGADTITLPAGTYTLTIPGTGENAAATGDLDITGDLTINGAGAATTIMDGAALDRVFHILSGATVTISGVTIRNGSSPGSSQGGGVLNVGTLTLNNSTISSNSAIGIGTSGGGGIDNGGTLTLNNSTVSGNSARNYGGGIINGGTLTLNNSTVSGNSITGNGFGGGISISSGTLTLNNSTISGNSATPTAGGIYAVFSGAATLKNTIVANNSVGNCVTFGGGTITSAGYNLSSDATCTFSGPGDLNNTPAHLVPLALNAPGTTQTHALCTGAGAPDPSCVAASPAINAVPLASCAVSNDQRGVSRPQGPLCDIGAYEVVVAPPVTCATRPSGMVSWWAADGNANDIMGGNHGTLKGNAGFAPGMVAQAFSFAAASDYVEVPSAANLNFGSAVLGAANNFSIDAWIKTNSNAQVLPIVDKRDLPGGPSAPQSTGYFLFLYNGKLAFQLGDGTFFNYISTLPDLRDGNFHHVAVTVNRTSPTGGTLYVDGNPWTFDPTNRQGSLTNTKSLFIGRHAGDPNITFIGLIDEVEIFNVAVPQSDILAIYNAGSAGKCKGIPVPTGPNIFSSSFLGCSLPPPVPTVPVLSNTPASAQPLAVANQTPTNIDVEVAFNAFLGPVDIYVAVEFPPSTGYPPTGASTIWFASGANVWGTTPVPLRTPPSAAAVNMTAAAGSPIYNGLPPAPGSGTFTAYVTVVPPGTPVNPVTFNFTTSPHYTWCYFKTF